MDTAPRAQPPASPTPTRTHVNPRFYKFGVTAPPLVASPEYLDNYANPAFQREDLDITQRATASYTHTWTDDTNTVQTITRSFDDEMTNYANWFAYYRTRILSVKTVTSLTFLGKSSLGIYNVDDTLRIGFHTLSNGGLNSLLNATDPATFVDVQDFDLDAEGDVGDAVVQRHDSARAGDAEPRRDHAHRRVLQEWRQRQPCWRDGPDHPVVPEELAHAVHRRLYQPECATDVQAHARGSGRHGSRAAGVRFDAAAGDGIDGGRGMAASVP